jgi:N-terminal acetyltransferase 2
MLPSQRTLNFLQRAALSVSGPALRNPHGLRAQSRLSRLHSRPLGQTISQPRRPTGPRAFSTTARRLASRPDPNKPVQNPAPGANPAPPSSSAAAAASPTLGQRMRTLTREYGWSAAGVYLFLTAVDLPFCFLAVRWAGTERIGEWEKSIVEWVKRASPVQIPERWRWGGRMVAQGAGVDGAGEEAIEQTTVKAYDHGVREAERRNSGENASKP